jgi:BarA-like signal transduction histidine kinase
MAAKEITPTQVTFRTAISQEDKKVFDQLLLGQQQSASSVLGLLKKFF